MQYGSLTIKDVCDLANAGVKLDWCSIEHYVDRGSAARDPVYISQMGFEGPDGNEHLTHCLLERLSRGKPADMQIFAVPSYKALLATKLSPDKVAVFLVHGDQHYTLEDDYRIFPSDALITQIRLITA